MKASQGAESLGKINRDSCIMLAKTFFERFESINIGGDQEKGKFIFLSAEAGLLPIDDYVTTKREAEAYL